MLVRVACFYPWDEKQTGCSMTLGRRAMAISWRLTVIRPSTERREREMPSGRIGGAIIRSNRAIDIPFLSLCPIPYSYLHCVFSVYWPFPHCPSSILCTTPLNKDYFFEKGLWYEGEQLLSTFRTLCLSGCQVRLLRSSIANLLCNIFTEALALPLTSGSTSPQLFRPIADFLFWTLFANFLRGFAAAVSDPYPRVLPRRLFTCHLLQHDFYFYQLTSTQYESILTSNAKSKVGSSANSAVSSSASRVYHPFYWVVSCLRKSTLNTVLCLLAPSVEQYFRKYWISHLYNLN